MKETLDRLYRTYDRAYLRTDPLRFVHRYRSRLDREVVGFLAASLAYGRVAQINRNLERVLGTMGDHPGTFAVRFSPARHARVFDPIKHRFHGGRDIAALVYAVRQMVEGWGSIERFFVAMSPDSGTDAGSRIGNFSRGALDLDFSPFLLPGGKIPPGVRFTFPLPSGGSACKRLNLYLRWMVRRGDGIDLGLWRSMSPSELLIPLDTHVSRVAYAIGLTDRRQTTWKAALEVTASLAALDRADPVKYDFSLCRLGVLRACTTRRDAAKCGRCTLRSLCRFPLLDV